MSLVLSNTEPGGPTVKTSWQLLGKDGHPVVLLGDYIIPMSDFVRLVGYVLTNTPLDPEDPRLQLVERIKLMQIVEKPKLMEIDGVGAQMPIRHFEVVEDILKTETEAPPVPTDGPCSKPRHVLIKGVDTGRICPPGYDFCWECGQVAPAEEFLKHDRCPSPACPHPTNWND